MMPIISLWGRHLTGRWRRAALTREVLNTALAALNRL
jgi:hypothetical protein